MDTLCASGGILEALNVHVHGNGTQTLVLSHGYGSDQTVWHYIIPYLALFFKVVVYDLVSSPNVDTKLYNPSIYNSSLEGYANDLICILDKMNISKSIYLGHSMSATIGCVAATRKPELFQHLILLSGSPRYLNAKGYHGGFNLSEVTTLFEIIKANYTSFIQFLAPRAIGVNSTSAIMEFERTLGRMDPGIALSVAKSLFLSDLRWILPKVKVPCSIIQSREDYVVPLDVSFYMKSELGSEGKVKVKVLKTKGHLPQISAYRLLLKALRSVLHMKTC